MKSYMIWSFLVAAGIAATLNVFMPPSSLVSSWQLFMMVLLGVICHVDNGIVLQRLATTDPLTGARNRRSGMGILQNEGARSVRYRDVFSVVGLDLDKFKSINDKHGHAAGDAVLIHAVSVITGLLRKTDAVIRMGGEEFVVVLPRTTAQNAAIFAERLRAALECVVSFEGAEIPVSASLGVAEFTDGGSVEVMLAAADQALYAAKEGGRNRVVVAGA